MLKNETGKKKSFKKGKKNKTSKLGFPKPGLIS
jgi:hypothetical protein